MRQIDDFCSDYLPQVTRAISSPALLDNLFYQQYTSKVLCFLNLTINFFASHCAWKCIWIWKQGTRSQDIIFYLFRNLKTLASLSFSRHFDCLSRADPWHQEISGVPKVGFSKFVHSVMPDECVHKPCELNSWTAKFVWNSILRSRYRQISITLEIQNTYSLCSHSWVILRDLGNFCFIVW